ncbi:hypothetical protein [Lysobacter sp. Root690]|uniref:hypothetical protein n=1 Tax=Lysobacter sp. Root690 TaxID=1736588 RepID=UPI0012F8B6B0|nr:hypothetical protein [Lysobacter sp. Root690]
MRISLRAAALSLATVCLFAAGSASAADSYTINLGTFQGDFDEDAIALANSELTNACVANGDTPGPITIHGIGRDGCNYVSFVDATITCHRK